MSLMDLDLGALPFLQTALARHLEEYPSSRSGLTRSEWQILRLVSDGVGAPGKLFVENMALEDALFIGDWTTYSIIAELCACASPLLHCDPEGRFRHPANAVVSDEAFRGQRLRLTEAGAQVMAGQRDAFGMIERDRWLGGVHLRSDRPMWDLGQRDTKPDASGPLSGVGSSQPRSRVSSDDANAAGGPAE